MIGARPPLTLLSMLYSDLQMNQIFSEDSTIESWLKAEAALAWAQAQVGVLTHQEAKEIGRAAVLSNIDRERLWSEAHNVGYPILPLVRMVAAALPPEIAGRVHYGATTQDIMDTGLALQLNATLDRLQQLLWRLGDALVNLATEHQATVMAARTHAQQAVPTTFGAKLAVFLAQLTRYHQRLLEARPRMAVVSLYGAGGTSAALGNEADQVRQLMAQRLGLAAEPVPWHVARDGILEFGALCAGLSSTCARLAREVVELSRTEVGEVRECDGHHRGASSTMPQKANPIYSEAVIGMAAVAGAMVSSLHLAMQAGHERAAGEWQIEWQVVPQVACLAAGCLLVAAEIIEGLQVFPEAMRRNLDIDGGLIMAEAYMIRLAKVLGQAGAHDLVYKAAQTARQTKSSLVKVLAETLSPELRAQLGIFPLRTEDYLGQAEQVCRVAIAEWQALQKEVYEHR